jgi:septal ring factor EnvC (AmiA/AmiB activator)
VNYDDWKADNEPTRAQMEERIAELERSLERFEVALLDRDERLFAMEQRVKAAEDDLRPRDVRIAELEAWGQRDRNDFLEASFNRQVKLDAALARIAELEAGRARVVAELRRRAEEAAENANRIEREEMLPRGFALRSDGVAAGLREAADLIERGEP